MPARQRGGLSVGKGRSSGLEFTLIAFPSGIRIVAPDQREKVTGAFERFPSDSLQLRG